MIIEQTQLDGLVVATCSLRQDPRGSFARLFCEEELKTVFGDRKIVQINQSRTAAVGAVRGLHYQYPPFAEMKLVRCLRGRVWDVAVDLRRQSPTFLKWHAVELSPASNNLMIVPEGFAHGFQVLESDSELLYLHTSAYTPNSEGGLHCEDPGLAISWPLAISELSERDRLHLPLTTSFDGIAL